MKYCTLHYEKCNASLGHNFIRHQWSKKKKLLTCSMYNLVSTESHTWLWLRSGKRCELTFLSTHSAVGGKKSINQPSFTILSVMEKWMSYAAFSVFTMEFYVSFQHCSSRQYCDPETTKHSLWNLNKLFSLFCSPGLLDTKRWAQSHFSHLGSQTVRSNHPGVQTQQWVQSHKYINSPGIVLQKQHPSLPSLFLF